MKIKIKKGLDIPLPAKIEEEIQTLPFPNHLALDLQPFDTILFKILKKEGECIKVGEPLAQDKKCPNRLFVSPASGIVKKVVRGLKRRLLSIVIETDHKQTPFEEKKETFFEGGLAPHIQMRPGLRIAHPQKKPEVIFIKGIESAPYIPPPEFQIQGNETFFSAGLEFLKKLAPVHLVIKEGSTYPPFINVDVHIHTASGPHPIANPSVHIAAIHPITRNDQVIWTLSVIDVIALGKWDLQRTYHTERVVSVVGEKGRYYRIHAGFPIKNLFQKKEGFRIISGDPLMGKEVDVEDYLGFYHQTVCSIPQPKPKRECLHFLKINRKGYTASKAYFFRKKVSAFSTLLHGENRAFVDGDIYNRVMPLSIETMPLIKMLLTEEYDKGEALGLLGVHPEDFALPTFICPSKIEMTEIVQEGLKAYAQQYLDE